MQMIVMHQMEKPLGSDYSHRVIMGVSKPDLMVLSVKHGFLIILLGDVLPQKKMLSVVQQMLIWNVQLEHVMKIFVLKVLK